MMGTQPMFNNQVLIQTGSCNMFKFFHVKMFFICFLVGKVNVSNCVNLYMYKKLWLLSNKFNNLMNKQQ